MPGSSFLELFAQPKPILAMLHLAALPGTPRARLKPTEILAQALEEARICASAGVDGLILENMADRPYLNRAVGPEVCALMAVAAAAVRQQSGLPCGVQVLAGANREALAIALAAGLDFVRVEGFVFAHVADEGLIDACAGSLLRYRRAIGAEHVLVLADIKKKHSAHALTADVDLVETARAAAFFLADGVVVTGTATGQPTEVGDLRAVSEAVELPVLAGSGVGLSNLPTSLSAADALIVGSAFKVSGHWSQPVDAARVESFMHAVRAWRAGHGS